VRSKSLMFAGVAAVVGLALLTILGLAAGLYYSAVEWRRTAEFSACMERGAAWHEQGQIDRAIAEYDAALRIDPKSAEAYSSRGDAWRDNEDLDKAVADYTASLQLAADAAVYLNRGLIWHDRGEYEKAIADFGAALPLDPKNAYVFFHRGNSWSDLGEHDKAIGDYTRAVRLDPVFDAAFFNRGWEWDERGEYAKAVADFTESLRLNPDDASAYVNRGRAWERLNETLKAIADYSEAIALEPEGATAYANRGKLRLRNQQTGEAVADFDAVLRLDPQDDDVLYARAMAQLILRSSDAIAGFQSVLDLENANEENAMGENPNDENPIGLFAVDAAVMGHFAARFFGDAPAALRFLDAAETLDHGTDPRIPFLRREMDADELLKRAAALGLQAEAHACLGLESALTGRTPEAIEHFRWVQAHGRPASPDRALALAELQRLEHAAVDLPPPAPG
jgi:tetratricopeptide (TPR) repeat protein